MNISSSSNHHRSKQTVTPPITVDQLSLMFYAILLLQTSLHNVNAAKSSLGKQNVNQFIKNVHGECCDFLSLAAFSCLFSSSLFFRNKTLFADISA
ncbi:unnamed protein product [Trichobilharzia regenti]|nr:unnamed protein product [Trichobilharzia regenti]